MAMKKGEKKKYREKQKRLKKDTLWMLNFKEWPIQYKGTGFFREMAIPRNTKDVSGIFFILLNRNEAFRIHFTGSYLGLRSQHEEALVDQRWYNLLIIKDNNCNTLKYIKYRPTHAQLKLLKSHIHTQNQFSPFWRLSKPTHYFENHYYKGERIRIYPDFV